jgi:hypothetical protein
LTTTDWIQFWLAIGTGILAIISTIAIIITIIQNKRIIESAKRAFLLMYKDTISITSSIEYLVIKNSGNTTAHITSISYKQDDIDLLSKEYSKLNVALNDLNNSYIAPNQSYKIPIKSKNTGINTLNFSIKYTSDKKEYSDSFTINLTQDYSIPYVKQSINNNDLKVISQALQELIKRID